MKLISRTPRLSPAEMAEVEAVRIRAEDERRRLAADFARDQAAAEREDRRRAEREHAKAERRRRKARAKAQARRRRQLARLATTARTVAPLLVVNAATVGGQLAYAYDQTPADWPEPLRVAVAIGVAAAAETVALYVGWHAHDALLKRAYGTAARLRRASYAIALVMAAVNYSHFAKGPLDPTALAIILGVLSSLSPWLWGLHTRRAQHVQLLREALVDETGAVFGPDRRRAFPIRSWQARRWSIDNNVRDPKAAWAGYKADRAAKRSAVQPGRARWAWAVLRGRAVASPVAPTTEAVLDESDPGVQVARRLQQQMRVAREAIRPQLGRLAVVGHSLGLWPAGPALPPATTTPATVAAVTTKPATKRPTVAATVGPKPTTTPATKPATVRTEADRTAAAYRDLVAALGRPPSGSELAAKAGVSKSYANSWKRNNLDR
ncbi:hypothetical protein ACQEUV_26805 [Micromonospora aurantiaca (nom. illeg.)]|uniref:hypothetical protein n=1 Tax=Micromonospora aurantiaca (nom. illeg.) TaxID=47850 RepID=UPI003DA6B755